MFHADTVSFLGFIVAPGRVQMDPAKVSAVADWPTPDSRKKVQQFLGFVNCYRRFVRGFSAIACHPGVKRIMFVISRRFWWPAMEPEVGEYIEACSVCARNKTSSKARTGLLQPLPIPSRPWSDIFIDFVTGLPVSQGNTTILTVVDRFSKMVKFIALPKLPSAKEKAEVMMNQLF